jgi:outer membrane receptor protein involved in Fe transport
MYTPGRRLRTHSFLAAASLAAACASQPSALARPAAPVDLNAPATSRGGMESGNRVSRSAGEITLGDAARYARMEDLLRARVPALDVRSIGAGRFTMRVRGRAELANAEPVVVIDGMRYVTGGVDMLASLAPRQVKRIEVLKDAASAAGSVRVGTSGVVVVTTWRGDH